MPGTLAFEGTRYEVVHSTEYLYSETVSVCHNEIHLAPRASSRQRVLSHHVDVDPAPTLISSHLDYFGNDVGRFSIEQAHDRLLVRATSRVEVGPAVPSGAWPALPWESVRDRPVTGNRSVEALQFLLDSPYARRSDGLAEWAAVSFSPGRPWGEAVFDLTARIHRDFAYDPQATTTGTPVEEVFSLRRGVCQDFAHVQIACLRSLGLPARYVSGYLSNERSPSSPHGGGGAGMIGADASHAWVSCWAGDAGWFDLDPTNDCAAGPLHVTIGWGRDYGDVCPIKGVYVGGGRHGMQVAVRVTRLDAIPRA